MYLIRIVIAMEKIVLWCIQGAERLFPEETGVKPTPQKFRSDRWQIKTRIVGNDGR